MSTPRRQLTLVDAVCLIVGVIIGVGIYECAPTVAAASSSPAAVLGFWVLGGLISLCGALCYAELATAYPRAGGDYEYLTRAYGPRAGFLFGWFLVALIRPGDIALLALIFSRYALAMAPEFLPASQAWLWYRVLAVGGVILLTAIHVIGVRYGKFVQNGLTTVKVLGILAVIGLALLGGGHLTRNDSTQSMSTLADSTPATSNEESIVEPVTDVSDDDVAGLAEQASTDSADDLGLDEVPSDDQADEISGTEASGGGSGPTFGLALILILFTYGGWNEMAYLAAEMERPEKNILRGLVIGACGVMGIYVLMNVAFLYALGLGGLASSQAVAVDAVSGVLSTLGQSVIGALICISALGAVSALIFTGSRIAYAIGQDYPLFAFLGQWHPESETPMRALVVQALLSSLMIIILGDFLEALIYTSAAIYCFFLASCLAVIVLRWKEPQVERPYRVIGYPWTVIVFAAACLFLIYSAIEYRPVHGLALLVMLLLGCIVYAFQGPPRRSRMVGGISEEGGPEQSHNDRFSERGAAGGRAATEPWTNSGGDQHG